MKLVVPVKQAATLDEDFELDGDGRAVDPNFLEPELNEWDAFSLEAALQIREGRDEPEDEVIVVTVGDDEAEESLLACLANGADRAVRIWDDALAGEGDPLTVARVLAAAIARETPDLVLCGVQSSDAATSATGVALAGRLGLNHVAVVRRVELADGVLTVERELEGGLVELLAMDTPALLTIQTGINAPRYATFRAIKQARDKPLEVVTPAGVGIATEAAIGAAGARVVALSRPPRGDGARMLEGDADAVAAEITTILEARLGPGRGGAA